VLFCSSLAVFPTTTLTSVIYTLSLHDALPISDRGSDPARRRVRSRLQGGVGDVPRGGPFRATHPERPRRLHRAGDRDGPDQRRRSEEHTSELQSRFDLVCRLLLEKKKNQTPKT